jgi:hypothetical protein
VTIQALQKEGAEYVRRVRRSDSLPCADTGCRVSQRYSFVSYERVGDETTSTKMQAETNKEQHPRTQMSASLQVHQISANAADGRKPS